MAKVYYVEIEIDGIVYSWSDVGRDSRNDGESAFRRRGVSEQLIKEAFDKAYG